MELPGSYLISVEVDLAPVEGDDFVPDFDSRSLGRATRLHGRYNESKILGLESELEAKLNGRALGELTRGHQEPGIECRGSRENNGQ